MKPQLSKENLLINELIREYLKYNNYNHSLSVFLSESGQPADPPFERYTHTYIYIYIYICRDILSKELRIIEDKTTILFPLLYSLVLGLQKDKVTYGTGRKMEEENKLVDDDEDNLEPKPIMLQK